MIFELIIMENKRWVSIIAPVSVHCFSITFNHFLMFVTFQYRVRPFGTALYFTIEA